MMAGCQYSGQLAHPIQAHLRLPYKLLTLFCHVLSPSQSSWYDHDNTWNPPATWLPVHGHPNGCLWRPLLIEPVSFNTVAGEYQFKTYRSKRLGDISGIDVIKMILEFHCYQQLIYAVKKSIRMYNS